MISKKKFEKKEIHFRVVSPNGDDEYNLAHDTALDQIRVMVKDQGKWCYIDNDFRDPNSLTVADLDTAEDIILTNALAGGNLK